MIANTIIIQPPLHAISHKFISGSPEATGVSTGFVPANVSATACAAASNVIVIILFPVCAKLAEFTNNLLSLPNKD